MCDFDGPDGLRSGNAIVSCHMDADIMNSATVMCPRQVDGTETISNHRLIMRYHTPETEHSSHDSGIEGLKFMRLGFDT
ncbi:hypothetical protein BBBOND_0208760 [Babesia bigemina]|uniref:Uncharacterized protein n=1 Tax=Babesia bigemina TaxID=5866 RepID=A0A061D6U0_BABBI|nr:hypothetical protein BBBOND_0208760 [Babesia bigemina]CDR95722.1 hypothetical protein BBBOND_0208760 [Babesia bigemina]|eukprot:XP_012767908.1 hypothetical protein BBBOND_0208760 [Babesia bigemina]